VNRIYNRTTQAIRIYHRGPGGDLSDGAVGTFGGTHHVSHRFVFQEILTAHNDLSSQISTLTSPFGRGTRHDMSADEQVRVRELQAQQKIYLTGFSRGGAIVIAVAMLLENRGLPVEAIFLFDSVNRSTELPDTDIIPGNVRNCYHALRHIERSGSRESFSHTGFRRSSGVAGPPNAYFLTTHGGMGGTPWGRAGTRPVTTVASRTGARTIGSPFIDEGGLDGLTNVTPAQERAGMQEVKHWMWTHLLAHRVVTR
jgi:hypothetical protein